jgi:hypothetical protein
MTLTCSSVYAISSLSLTSHKYIIEIIIRGAIWHVGPIAVMSVAEFDARMDKLVRLCIDRTI